MNPTIEDYCTDKTLAGFFENQVLYQMCKSEPLHDCSYIVHGKLVAIGRIYAAQLERGVGKPKIAGSSVVKFAADRIVKSDLDRWLNDINMDTRIDEDGVLESVVKIHANLVDILWKAIRDWSEADKGRSLTSFASKYLHFHRPNAFPIMDSVARDGLKSQKVKGAFGKYETYCRAILKFAEKRHLQGWTPRSIDTKLLEHGRAYRLK